MIELFLVYKPCQIWSKYDAVVKRNPVHNDLSSFTTESMSVSYSVKNMQIIKDYKWLE